MGACSQHQHLQQGKIVDGSGTILHSEIGLVGQSINFPLYESCNKRENLGDTEQSLESGISEVDEITNSCPDCHDRLFHIASNTLITAENRVSFIADGNMYEEVARLCQEHAQDLIQKEGCL